MAWYRAGTVTVTTGSAVVTGTGTDFVANANPGDVFAVPGGGIYEVASVQTATQLTLATGYLGATGGGQGYALAPTQSFARDLALAAAQLLGTFGAVRDGIGAGLIGDGNVATPAIRFSGDQDTGFFRFGPNVLGVVAGGQLGTLLDANGIRVEKVLQAGLAEVGRPGYAALTANGVSPIINRLVFGTDGSGWKFAIGKNQLGVVTDLMTITDAGDMLVGIGSSVGGHRLVKAVAPDADNRIVQFERGDGLYSAIFYSVSGGVGAAARAAVRIGFDAGTNRSINAGGTVNASGADYAEYMTKAPGCGTIAPGQVCGVDAEGLLTLTWTDAVAFVVKSTDPAYVGGDNWASHLPERPEAPQEPVGTGPAPELPDSDDAAVLRAWRDAVDAHAAALARHQQDHAAWTADMAAHEAALAGWEADLEAARQKVDRIAFAGQVPVDVHGTFAPGDYLIAEADGAGICAVAVPDAGITFDQYRRRIGRVWAVHDGRAWIDVQHG